MNAPLFTSTWQWRRLALCQGLALGLLLLWLIPAVRSQLLAIDAGLFHALNAPLAHSTAWLYLWTFFSLRPVDALVGLVLLALLIRGGWAYPAQQVRPALAVFIGLLVVLLIVRTLLTKGIEAWGLQHSGPSDILSGAYLLSERFPGLEHGWELKDRSGASFPGDHASVLLLWALFMAHFTRGGRRLVVAALAVLFMLPRLVAGAHWGSDDYIGGLALALGVISLGLHTPLAAVLARQGERLLTPPLRGLGRLPLLGRLSLLRP